MAKILVLGGSGSQMNAILRLKQRGHTVIVSDYYENAPGKDYADYSELVSTFDVEGNMEVARKYGIDGIIAVGTDQPVYTAARVAEEFGLPFSIDAMTAKAVTNKRIMKEIFTRCEIPAVKYEILKEDFSDKDVQGIKFPVVIKPLDSQGQRGVYRLESPGEVRRLFREVLSYSREKEILIEEFYESGEITVSGWAHNGKAHILTVTDRVTCSNDTHIGVCTAHNFPSKYLNAYYDKIVDITDRIVSGFEIREGPLYFQMFVGNEGIKVNEIACRIGGAYEDEFIPLLTGVDILDMAIDAALGKCPDYSRLKTYELRRNSSVGSVQMIFARPGTIGFMSEVNEIRRLPGVMYAGFNFKPGYTVKEITDAMQRAGYMIITGEDRISLEENIVKAFERLKLLDEKGRDMLIPFYMDNKLEITKFTVRYP